MRNITLTIPNDDTTALRHFGKALIEIASEKEGRPLDISNETLQQALPRMMDAPEVDTTAQQVESLAKNTVDREVHFDDPVPQASDITDSTGTPWDERIHSTSKALNADGTWRLRRKPKDMDEAEWAAFVETVKNELNHGEEIREAMDKAERGEAVYYTSEEAEQKMEEFKESVRQSVEPPVTPPGEALYAPENYVHMYRATDNIYGLAKSDAELADFEADGYVRHTQEQYDAWEGPNTTDEGDDHHTDAGVVTEQTVAGIPPLPVPPPVVVAPPVPEVTTWDFPRLMTFLTERHGKIDVATVNTLLAQDGMLSVQELNAHPDKIGPFVARVKAHLGE
jgi:hypothetical protein